MRKLVIGDIHGGLRAFKQVLERCGFDPKKDQIIFLGDYSDGWSETAELIEELINLEGDHIFLLGNHDKWTREWLNFGASSDTWTLQGGQETIDSYIRTGHISSLEHKAFFNDLKPYYIDDQNRAFVHGGYTSPEGLGHEQYEADYYWNRDLFSVALSGHASNNSLTEKLPRILRPHKEIFIGHTSTVNWNYAAHIPAPEGYKNNDPVMTPINACNVWNMDTGGGFYGKLTIMDVDTKEYWQSDLVKDLYPDEKGR